MRKEQSKRQQVHGGGRKVDQANRGGSRARVKLVLDSAGRVVVPIEFRRAMNAEVGSELLARVVDGELRLVTPDMAVQRAQKLVREMIPGDVSLAESLIADRRREVAQESEDG